MKNNFYKYYSVYKPYGMLSQFSDEDGRETLKSLYKFPKDVYPIGRLDSDSEGLLILSNDKSLVDLLLNPKNHHEKEYFVQVEGIPDETALKKLAAGVTIKDYKTLPVKVKVIDEPELPERIPPVRFRKSIPTSWISLTITEGKNRQVRRMTASIGFPTLRLVRVRICNLKLNDLKPGEVRELTSAEIGKLKSQFEK
ncbi:MAG: pseudouridine synthase [Ignavibacteriales bacterium]